MNIPFTPKKATKAIVLSKNITFIWKIMLEDQERGYVWLMFVEEIEIVS